jgi:hypothetical protein
MPAVHNAWDCMGIAVEQGLVGSRGGPLLPGGQVISMEKIGWGATEHGKLRQ